jgi:small subunit ribosomal protein S6
MMRTYEVVCIVQPDFDEAAFHEVIEKVKTWITDSDGTIDKVDIWGKRQMAYRIRKQREGLYVLIQAQMSPASTADLERNLNFLEPVMRFMITMVS